MESVNEVASRTAMEIGALTGLNKNAVQDFVDKHELDIEKLYKGVKSMNLAGRMNLVTAIAGKPGNSLQKLTIKLNKKNESVNEGFSTEEKRIVLMAVKKISKYMNVDLPTAMNYLLGAGQELERDIQKGKVK
jgi:phage terminase large subunit